MDKLSSPKPACRILPIPLEWFLRSNCGKCCAEPKSFRGLAQLSVKKLSTVFSYQFFCSASSFFSDCTFCTSLAFRTNNMSRAGMADQTKYMTCNYCHISHVVAIIACTLVLLVTYKHMSLANVPFLSVYNVTSGLGLYTWFCYFNFQGSNLLFYILNTGWQFFQGVALYCRTCYTLCGRGVFTSHALVCNTLYTPY